MLPLTQDDLLLTKQLAVNHLKRLLPQWARTPLVRLRYRLQIPPAPVLGLGCASPAAGGRALVSYLTTPFRMESDDPKAVQFSNVGIARGIIQVLEAMGYTVDVVEWTDHRFVPRAPYSLFVGHGPYNYVRLARSLPSHCVRIYFSSGCYWRASNDAERQRFTELRRRRGCHLPYDRWVDSLEERANRVADGILCLGDRRTKETYASFPCVEHLNNAAYYDSRFETVRKDHAAARRNFLFFAGTGSVHKGLDLLLEAFEGLDAHLYVCQSIGPDFHHQYRRELHSLPNIHLVGPVRMRSPQFYDVADRCAYTIHPSCAEGQPGAVIECMLHGLIPVVTPQCHLDVEGFGVELADHSIETIRSVVRELADQPVGWCEQMSHRTRQVALREYSEEKFRTNLISAVRRIIQITEQERLGMIPC